MQGTIVVAVVGPSGCGKSRFVRDLIGRERVNGGPTLGIDFESFRAGTRTVFVYDTSGDERYLAMVRGYLQCQGVGVELLLYRTRTDLDWVLQNGLLAYGTDEEAPAHADFQRSTRVPRILRYLVPLGTAASHADADDFAQRYRCRNWRDTKPLIDDIITNSPPPPPPLPPAPAAPSWVWSVLRCFSCV